MSEHRHEWELTHPYIPSAGEPQQIDVPRSDAVNMIVCHECGTLASWEHILKALNATERLSAEDAREIAIETHSAWWPLEGESPYKDGLRAYAFALEDK